MTASRAELQDAGRRWSSVEVTVAIAAFGLAAAAIVARTIRPPSTTASVAAAVFFVLVPGCYIALSIEGVRRSVRSIVAALPSTAQLVAGPAVLWLAIMGYAASSGLTIAPRLAAYAVYLLIPPLLLALPPGASKETPRMPLPELTVVFALWLPIEFRILPSLPLPRLPQTAYREMRRGLRRAE